MAPQQPPNPASFWDFAQYSNPGQPAGNGVDRSNPQAPNPAAPFPAGFPFAWGGGPHGAHGPQQPPVPPQPPQAAAAPVPLEPPAGPWSQFGWGAAGPPFHRDNNPRHWGGRGRRGYYADRHGHGHGHEHEHEHEHEHGHGRRHRSRHERRDGSDGEKRDHGVESASDSERERDAYNEKKDSPDTLRDGAPDPAEVAPEEGDAPREAHGRWGGRGFGGRGAGCRRGGPFGSRHSHGHGHSPRGPHHGNPAFDLPGMIRGFVNHPYFQNLNLGDLSGNNARQASNEADVFSPPVDVFNTERAFILHVALPGAKKEDVAVNWDPDSSTLNISGIVLRPGDEQFLASLASGERTVGMFERNIVLPPAGAATEREEVDGFGISAKLEDGVLAITVPKVEKEWTEIRKVDIE